MDKFWRWATNEASEKPIRTLHMEGYIAETSWFDDDITPKQFKAELYEGGDPSDDIIVKIHSPGGDCFAAAQIYNMLKEYPGRVSVHVDGLAASAASVIAMAGDEVCLSPLSVLMIHNPAMFIAGEVSDLEAGINLLNEVKESIINAYQLKTGLSRTKISHMMNAETWMSAHKAIELKFADRLLYTDESTGEASGAFIFDKLTVTNALINKLPTARRKKSDSEKQKHEALDRVTSDRTIPVAQLHKRLELIKNWR
ncbi:Clp protease ClpP [Heliorestis acidaminivorans]|uniref:ATP-dependent Clp protease proteolytic subunit n=1 Tax=Heliorestis acidaminivorans TaxID=553427 RepID=A0A6I0F4W9_9FIRM|nr:head maturation protease, ClpP-related [Heliorestis acidaminivorans]KAB2953727.1 Clp protease ClpP [Heliorestis acidaminivorans]